jgi:hypothetical protein
VEIIDKAGLESLKKLISCIEGAPYPNSVDEELYTIWYEHAQRIAQEALEYYNETHYDEAEVHPELSI